MRAKCSVCGEVFQMVNSCNEMYDSVWIESEEMIEHIKKHPDAEDAYWELIDLKTDFDQAHKLGVWGEYE